MATYTDEQIQTAISNAAAQGYDINQIIKALQDSGVAADQTMRVASNFAGNADELNVLSQVVATTYAPTASSNYSSQVDPTVEKNLQTLYPEYAQLSDAGKQQFWNDFTAMSDAERQTLTDRVTADWNSYSANKVNTDIAWGVDAFTNMFGAPPNAAQMEQIKGYFQAGGDRQAALDFFAKQPETQTTQGLSALDKYRYGLDANSPVYGTQIGGLGLPSAPNINTAQNMAQYGQTVAGYDPAKYGEDVRGLGMVDYNRDVATPMESWQYEQSPAFLAKQQLMSQDINNRLAARGIRGATAVNMLEDQTRKLTAEDYSAERAFALDQLIKKYQAQGLEYDKAYQAASNEYGLALTSQNQNAQQATTDALQNYQMSLAQYQDMYNKRAQEAASAYDKIINEIKIGQNAAGSIASAGQNLATGTSAALGAAGAAAGTSALQSGIASAGLYSGLGNMAANLLGNTSTQKAFGNLTGLGSTATGTTGYLGA